MEIEKLSKYINLVAVGLGIFITVKTCSLDDTLGEIEQSSKNMKLDQEKIAFDRDFKFKIYEITKLAISS